MSEMFLQISAIGDDKVQQAALLRAVDGILANHPALEGVQVEFKNVRTRVRTKDVRVEVDGTISS